MRPILSLLLTILPLAAQSGAKNGEWTTYGGDLGNTHYSPLDQINAGNFNKLQVAWRFKTDNFGPRPETNLQATPLMVKGVLYTTAGTRRDVVALECRHRRVSVDVTAKTRARAGRTLPGSSRAAAWRTGPTADAEADERILYVTPGYRLIALNAKTGVPVPGFGSNGVVDLKLERRSGHRSRDRRSRTARDAGGGGRRGDRRRGSSRVRRRRRARHNVKGYVRGFDVRTGKRLWIFHTIPRPGEFGYDTWEKDSAEYTGNAGVWGQISVDRGPGNGVHPGGTAHRRLIWRPPAGQRSVRRKHRRGGSEDRPAEVALPTGAPRHLGFRYSLRADADRYHDQRADGEGRRAADQAGDPLYLRSCDRPADLAHRGKARAQRRRAGRVVFAHATDAHQAAAVWCRRHSVGGRSDRFHARTSGRGVEGGLEVQDGPDLYADRGEQAGRTVRDRS